MTDDLQHFDFKFADFAATLAKKAPKTECFELMIDLSDLAIGLDTKAFDFETSSFRYLQP